MTSCLELLRKAECPPETHCFASLAFFVWEDRPSWRKGLAKCWGVKGWRVLVVVVGRQFYELNFKYVKWIKVEYVLAFQEEFKILRPGSTVVRIFDNYTFVYSRVINSGIRENSWSVKACVSCSVVGLRGPPGTKAKVGEGRSTHNTLGAREGFWDWVGERWQQFPQQKTPLSTDSSSRLRSGLLECCSLIGTRKV